MGSGSGGGYTWKGLHGHRSTIPVAQAPDPRRLGDTAQDPVLPLEQAEARRTQDSRMLLPLVGPELYRLLAPAPRISRPLWAGTCGG